MNANLKALLLQAALVVGSAAMAGGIASHTAQAGIAALTAQEQADLRFMREEEKLAHDVYVALGKKWQLRTFDNISASEQTHVSAMLALLKTHGLPDPSASLPAGRFAEPKLQSLYDKLVADGSKSLVDALKVGAAIEEIDILDLDSRIAAAQAGDVKISYAQLRRASWNHLAAFVGQLQREGITYAPQYLDKTRYEDQLPSRRNGSQSGPL